MTPFQLYRFLYQCDEPGRMQSIVFRIQTPERTRSSAGDVHPSQINVCVRNVRSTQGACSDKVTIFRTTMMSSRDCDSENQRHEGA